MTHHHPPTPTHTHTHTHTHTRQHTQRPAREIRCLQQHCTADNTCTHTHTHTHTHKHTVYCTQKHKSVNMLSIAPLHRWTHTHTHTHKHAHTHTHTHTLLGCIYCIILFSCVICTGTHWHLRSEEHTSELQSHLNLVCRR